MSVQHRRHLDHPHTHRPSWSGGLLARAGESAAVDAVIDELYDRIEVDTALRPLFGRELENERLAQKRFFTEWLGGTPRYTETAHHSLAERHHLLPITRALAARWLAHFRASLEIGVRDADARREIFDAVHALAMALINEREPVSALRAHPHGTCLRYPPAVEALRLAGRGDAQALATLLTQAPDVLASTIHAAKVLQVATLSGRASVVELLLARGVDVNKPAPVEPLICITPLCAARAKNRRAVEVILLANGAREDVFTHAYLGALEALQADLARDASLAQARDPALDALEITAVHHAVAGEHVEALRVLLLHTSEPIAGGARALKQAVSEENVAMVAILLGRGADAAQIGAGRWVLHPELAPMLAREGARVDRSGSWIALSCTGNQGRKDDPQYVAALLSHGARADDRRLIGQGSDGGHASALHYAAKAGFVKTIVLLLEHGGDPHARDDNDRTPLDWLERAAKTVDRGAVRSLFR